MFSSFSNFVQSALGKPRLVKQYSLTDCEGCLDDRRQSTVLCSKGHRLCLPCALTSLRTEVAEAATRADGSVWCPTCRGEMAVAGTPDGHSDGSDPLAGWILPAVVEKLNSWSNSASEEDRRPVPGAPALAPLSASELRRYTVRLVGRAVAHRRAILGAAEPNRSASADDAEASLNSVVAPDAWEAAGFRESLVTCPFTACGADFLLPALAAAEGAGAPAPAVAGAAAGSEPSHGSACPHCRELLCADCGEPWTVIVSFNVLPQLPPAPAPAPVPAPRAAATNDAGGASWLAAAALAAVGGAGRASTAAPAPAAPVAAASEKRLAIYHKDGSCAAFARRVETARLLASRRTASPLSHAEWLALPNEIARFDLAATGGGTAAAAASNARRPGASVFESASASTATPSTAGRAAEEDAFQRQVEEMAAAGVKYCPKCGAPGTHPWGHQ